MPNSPNNSSEYSSDSEEEVLSDDDMDIDSNNSNEDHDNDNEDDNEDNNEEEKDNEEEETPKEERPTTSDVWEFVDKTTRKCPSCGKVFKKTTGTSSIRSHLQNHGMLLVKAKQTSLDHFVK